MTDKQFDQIIRAIGAGVLGIILMLGIVTAIIYIEVRRTSDNVNAKIDNTYKALAVFAAKNAEKIEITADEAHDIKESGKELIGTWVKDKFKVEQAASTPAALGTREGVTEATDRALARIDAILAELKARDNK